MYMYKGKSFEELKELFKDHRDGIRRQVMRACFFDPDIPIGFIEEGLKDIDWTIQEIAFDVIFARGNVSKKHIELALKKHIKLELEWDWMATKALRLCIGRNDIDKELIIRLLSNEDCYIREAAYKACVDRNDINIQYLEKGLYDKYYDIRIFTYNVCKDRTDISTEAIEKAFHHDDWRGRLGAFKLCSKRPDILLNHFEDGLNDSNVLIRREACNFLVENPNAAAELIKKCLNDLSEDAKIIEKALQDVWFSDEIIEKGIENATSNIREGVFRRCREWNYIDFETLKKGAEDTKTALKIIEDTLTFHAWWDVQHYYSQIEQMSGINHWGWGDK